MRQAFGWVTMILENDTMNQISKMRPILKWSIQLDGKTVMWEGDLVKWLFNAIQHKLLS
jgi:hypothetical protein